MGNNLSAEYNPYTGKYEYNNTGYQSEVIGKEKTKTLGYLLSFFISSSMICITVECIHQPIIPITLLWDMANKHQIIIVPMDSNSITHQRISPLITR